VKKFVFIILPLILFDLLLARSSFAASPATSPTPTPETPALIQPGPNPGPPIGIPCGNTMCLTGEICVQYPGDIDLHCVPEDLDPNDIGSVNVPPKCDPTGVFPPNSSCWNNFKSTQTDITLYEKTCIYEPVVRYEGTRYLHGKPDEQPFDMCGIGNSGPGGPPAPGGEDDACTVAMLVYTDVRDAELGSYGPNTAAEADNSIDFLAQNYLYNALFGRPDNLQDKNREAYRTYWRLLPANNQADLRSFILNMAHDDLILNIKFNFTDTNGLQKETDFKSLYDALSKQVIFFTHFPFIRIGCLTKYPVCPEFAQATRELKPIFQDLLDTALELNIPGATEAIQAYNLVMAAFNYDLDGPYNAFVPLDFSGTRGYILKKKDEFEDQLYKKKYDFWLKDILNKPRYGTDKPTLTNVSRENLPYVGAIYDGLLSPKFGMFTALQPQWMTEKIINDQALTDYKLGNKPEDLPEIKISKRNLLDTITEEAAAFITNPFGWISSKVRSFFTDEDKKKGYTDIDVDNDIKIIREVYDNPAGCPLPLSYHLLSPKTAADAKGTKDGPLDDHHQVVWITGKQLAWNYDPEHRPMWKNTCINIKDSGGNIIGRDCGFHFEPCPTDDAHYVLGDLCYTRKWSVTGIKHGKGLNVLNNPKQTDIKEMTANNDKYSFYKMMLPAGASKITDASIDAPLAKNFVSYLSGNTATVTNPDGTQDTQTQGNLTDTATGPNGDSTILNPAEPINRINNLAQDSMHMLQNCWTVPFGLQNSPRCQLKFPEQSPTNTCSGEAFKKIVGNPDKPSAAGTSYFNSFINPKLTPEVISAYAEAEKVTGVPCEVLAGIHFKEGDNNPDQDLQSGAPLGGRSLKESAIQAAEELMGKAGGKIIALNQLIKALSYYNGGGNSNCQTGGSYSCPAATTDRCGQTVACASDPKACICSPRGVEAGSCRALCTQGFPYQFNYSYCPPASTGYDDPYVTNLWKSPVHDQMYILYMYDCTQTKPYIDTRPGTLTVAISLFLQGSATNSTKPNK